MSARCEPSQTEESVGTEGCGAACGGVCDMPVGVETESGKEQAEMIQIVQRPDVGDGYALANPPLNGSDRFRKDDDMRRQHRVPHNVIATCSRVQQTKSNAIMTAL